MDSTLFIGLGGTGGRVLRELYPMVSEKERAFSRFLYLDSDRRDIEDYTLQGIRCV